MSEGFKSDTLIAQVKKLLDRLGYRSLLIGGQAVIYHGHLRTTLDADFTVTDLPKRVELLVEEAGQLGYQPRESYWHELASAAMLLQLVHVETGFGIDISFNNSPYIEDCLKRAIKTEMVGQEVWLLGIEDLIIQKVVAHRLQDQIDVIELLNRHPDVDVNLIEIWLKQFEEATAMPLIEIFRRWASELD